MLKAFKKKLLIAAVVCFLSGLFFSSSSGVHYKTCSPDRQYSVYASSYHTNLFRVGMPGQSGDSPGKVFLYDEIAKKVLYSVHIPMMNMTGGIQWNPTEAYYIGDNYPNAINPWKLPRRILIP